MNNININELTAISTIISFKIDIIADDTFDMTLDTNSSLAKRILNSFNDIPENHSLLSRNFSDLSHHDDDDFVFISSEGKLLNYLKTTQCQESLETIQQRIRKGHALVSSIVSDTQQAIDNANALSITERSQLITDLMWYLMDLALKKGKGFNEGTFVINGAHKALYDFLRSFKSTYMRGHSHFKSRVPEVIKNMFYECSKGYGIDCASGPADKKHLLFELIDGGKMLFIKPENHGTDGMLDYICHAVGYAASVFRHIYGGNNEMGMQKERIENIREFCSLFDFKSPELGSVTYVL